MGDDHTNSASDLVSKVAGWLNTEGYPLEYRTATAFRRQGFHVRQGHYVRTEDEVAREIDVCAGSTLDAEDGFVRAYQVVECKWSQDKPWVVFSGPGGISSAACVSQSMCSFLGEAVLWTIAGLNSLHSLELFSTPRRPGFNGRQAFAKGNDVFYNAMSSVTSLAKNLLRKYDRHRPAMRMPRAAVVAFPVVVVDGKLFEAWFDDESNTVKLEGRQELRLHWQGAPEWSFHATIDVVVADHLDDFTTRRAAEVKVLLEAMKNCRSEIARCFAQNSLTSLRVPPCARGTIGLPPLLNELRSMSGTVPTMEG